MHDTPQPSGGRADVSLAEIATDELGDQRAALYEISDKMPARDARHDFECNSVL